MTRKHSIILISVVLTVIAIAIAVVCVYSHYQQTDALENQPYSTNDAGYAVRKVPHADSKIVGKWQSANQRGWYKVYYDDYDEQTKMFWGKEWHEEDSVTENYLAFHGNGWFRWEKKWRKLHEYATMDMCDVPIHREYKIRLLKKDSMVYFEPDYKKIRYNFRKVK